MGVTGVVVFVVIVLAVAVVAMVRERDPFKSAASQLSLKLTRTVPDLHPQLNGIVNGLHVTVDITTKRAPVVRYLVSYPALGMGLRLERETTITRTMGQLGRKDIQVGTTGFDDSFRIATSRPDALRTMMTPKLQRALATLLEHFPQVLIEDNSISLVGDTSEPPAATIVATIIEMAAAGHLLVEGRPPPPAKPIPEQPASTGVDKPDPSAAADGELPSPPSTEKSLESLDPPPADHEPPPAADPQPTGLPTGFFEDVFGTNRLTFESSSEFEEHIRGTLVRLSGTVKRAQEYEQDSDFGKGPGTKAVITVAHIDTDLYGEAAIDAVVQLPAGTANGLERDATITFEGTLDNVDPFMRNFLVTGASVIDQPIVDQPATG